MSKDELIEIGVVIVAALALFLFMRHGQAATPAGAILLDNLPSEVAPVTYTDANYPAWNSGAQTSLNAVQPATLASAAQAQQSCACGSGPVDYAGLNSFANYLTAQDEKAVSSYYSTVMGSLPSWITEFVNNTLAPDQTAASQGMFAGMAGL